MTVDKDTADRILGVMNWSERIKALQSAGWRPSEIAAEIGLSVTALSDLSTGRSAEPKGMAAVLLHKLTSPRIKSPRKRAA